VSCNYITAIFPARNKLVIDRKCPRKVRPTSDVVRNKLVSDRLGVSSSCNLERRNALGRVTTCHVLAKGLRKNELFSTCATSRMISKLTYSEEFLNGLEMDL